MAFYGAQTESALDDLHVDKLFLGVDGFDVERGITTHFEPEAMLNRKMVAAAARVIAVTDASKFGKTCLHRIINIDEIDDLVTAGDVPGDVQAAAERMRFAVHRA
jgi:DeoR family transcriptional regulator of aga operon